ncbi:hypothetical protein LLE87_29055, partial [Paenibacillus polymyxa]|nr:hypothetical protein [Paenibacillus polymyxa]
MQRQGDTPLDNMTSRTTIGALSLDYQGERLRASLDLLTQHEKIDAPTRPFLVAPGIAVPRAADGRRNATQPWGGEVRRAVRALARGIRHQRPADRLCGRRLFGHRGRASVG